MNRAFMVVVFLCAFARVISAQPGEWCGLGYVQPAGAGGHITWAGDSVFYFPGGRLSQLSVFDPDRCLTYSYSMEQVDTGATSVWAGGPYVYVYTSGRFGVFCRVSKSNPGYRDGLTSPGAGGPGGAMCWTGGDSLFAFLGGAAGTFTRYTIAGNTWSPRASPPAIPRLGAALAWAGGDTIYALGGNDSREFWAYSATGGAWTRKPELPASINAGAALSWNGLAGSLSRLLLTPGGGSGQLWSYSTSAATWDTLPRAPCGIGGASEGALAAFDRRPDHQHLYAVINSGSNRLVRYGSRIASTLPFSESFNGNQFPPQNWRLDWPLVTRRTSSTYPTAVPYHGSWMTVFALRGYPRFWTGLRTPPLLVRQSPRLVKVSFRMYQSSEVDNDTLYVGRSSDGVGYSLVAAFPRYAGVAGWYMKTVALETFESDTLYTVFYAHGGSVGSCNIYMDSLYIWQPLTYTAADAARDEEKSVWSQACAGDEVKGYAEYLRLYPTGLYVDSARTMAGRARCVPLAAEIDTICRIVEGFDCGLHTSSPLLLMQLRGTTVASSDERNFAHEQFDWYSRHVAMYNGMGRSGRFRATCDVLDASAKDISLVAGVCMEFIDYAQLVNYTPDQFSSVWKRMFPGGQDALLKNVEKPLKGELEQVGLSGSLAQGIWDAVRASCWSRELRMNKTFLPQRDSLYPLILDELQKSHRVGE